jgi:hypothetical protein
METLVVAIVLAPVLALVGVALTWLTAMAVRLPLDRRPTLPHLLPVAVPALVYAIAALWILAEIATQRSSANLWPLTLGLLVVPWLAWAGIAALACTLIRRLRRG